MSKRSVPPVRLNIYLPDVAIRRQVKAAAAKRDLSLSEYCVRAITAQLIRDGEGAAERVSPHSTAAAVAAARRFQAAAFKGKVFAVRSSELIREARRERSPS